MREYKLISADSHINEPPGLWVDRVPERFKDRAPKMVSQELGDAWIIEGALDPISFGLNQCGGYPPERYSPWVRWDDVRKGGSEPAARLLEQDEDRVDAEVMFPTPRISNSLFWHSKDVDFHLACIRAYNDWLAEFCGYAPERYGGIAMMPNVGAKRAIEEMSRVMQLPGIRGVMLGLYPHGGEVMAPEDDPFWAAAEEADVPLHVHVGFATQPQGTHERAGHAFTGAFTGAIRFFDASIRSTEFIYTKVFDRFPRLKLVLAEVDCGWIPYVMEQLDDRYRRQNPATRPIFDLRPSDYFRRNIFSTIVVDRYGVKNRREIGVDQIMWSSDFPHATCEWPNSWDLINEHFAGVPADERHKILAGNAVSLYKFA